MSSLSQDEPEKRASRGWGLIQLVVTLETIGMAAMVWVAIQGMLNIGDQPYIDMLSLLVLAVLGFGFSVLCLAGVLARRGWSRAASVVLQVLLFAVATAMLQGILGTTALGWVLIAVSVIGTVGAVRARAEDQTAELE